MYKIIEILKSIKFWTIVGVLASLAGLYYTFADMSDKDALALSVGKYVVKAPKEDKEIVIVNYVGCPDATPLLVPMPFGIANRSNKTIKNVVMNYFGDVLDWEQRRVVNKTVTPNIKLAPLYIAGGETLDSFEFGEGISVSAITPKSSAESNGDRVIYKPLISPILDGDYYLYTFPKLVLTLSADNSVGKTFKVQMYMAFVNYSKEDAIKRMADEVAQKYIDNASTLLFVPYSPADLQKQYEIGKIPFYKLSADLEKVLIRTFK